MWEGVATILALLGAAALLMVWVLIWRGWLQVLQALLKRKI
jgi:hypothetical protein